MNRRPLTVAVVGATGVVGRTMIQVLNEREFPVGELRLLASGRSAGRTVSIDGRTLEIGEAVADAFEGVDIALFSAGADVSRELAPGRGRPRRHRHRQLVAPGGWTRRSRSSSRRSTRTTSRATEGIIANPNCSTMQLVPVLMALRDAVGLERVVVDTYQSVSGTGARRDRRAREPDPRPRRPASAKVATRLPAPDRVQRAARDRRLPRTTATPRRSGRSSPRAARSSHLPDLRDLVHGGPHPGLRQPLRGGPRRDARRRSRPERARELFAAVPGVVVQDDPAEPRLPARDRGRRAATRSSSGASGATRRSPTTAASPSGSSSDNLRKGAATNAVEIAEVLARARLDPASGGSRRAAVPRRAEHAEATA